MAGPAGKTYTQAEFNEIIGGLARDTFVLRDRFRAAQFYLAQHTAGALDTMYAYDAGEGNEIKTAFNDMSDLWEKFGGTAGDATIPGGVKTIPYDYTTFLKRLAGIAI